MIQLKKTILTLVALLAVTTGAWADETLLLTIESKDNTSFTSGSMTFDDMVTVTFSNSVYNDGNNDGWYTYGESLLSVAGTNGYTITSCKFYTENYIAANGYNVDGESPSVYLYSRDVYTDANKSVKLGYNGVTKIEVYGTAPAASSAPTGPEVAWDKAKKTGTFTMPGGNVTVSVEYYDLATLADKGLTAAEDAAAKTEAPLAVLAENAVTGGTLMYYVIYDENFSQADAIALPETAWSVDIPTAEELNPAGGTYYVWYYIKGDDEHSDTDPQRLAVTVLPEPTYNVEFAEGTNNAPNKWTATPNPAKKGQQVTVTYEGPRKVMGVKAEKKGGAADNAYLKWNADQKKLVATEFPAEVITVENANQNVFWEAGTYVVEGNVTIGGEITLTGDVNLIIKDGAKLTAEQIHSANSNLSIFGQANQTGELVVNCSGDDAFYDLPTLEVHSAKVTATSPAGGCGGFYDIQTFNVYGGSVDAENTGGNGYGISLYNNGSMNIYGGEVRAEGSGNNNTYSFGIRSNSGATVTVYGGTLWAENADNVALRNNITLTKGDGFSGKIEYSSDNSTWSETKDTSAKYVRAGY